MDKENLFDFEGMEEGTSSDDMFDFSEATDESTEEVIEEAIETEDDTNESENIDEVVDNVILETTDESTGEDDDFDLDSLINSLDSEIEASNDALDKIEESGSTNSADIGMLRDSLKKMEDQLRKLNNEKADLQIQNMELEAYSMSDSDPKVMILYKNYSKAKDGDDQSKTKSVNALKDMLYDLTGEDFDETKINKDIDILTASEMYNNEINPNLSKGKEEDDVEILI